MFKTYLKAILIPLLLGALIGFLTQGQMDFARLQKPPLAPPAWLFPVVWSILYTLMGISYARLQSKNLVTADIQKIYYFQLLVNLIWPIIFFTLSLRLIALIWIIILDILVLKMVITFYKQEKWVGLIQIPYLIWVLFATYLNLFFFLLN